MPANPTNPTWIEPPPKNGGMGCGGKGCLALAIVCGIVFVLLLISSYRFVSNSRQPTSLPVKELPPEELTDLNQRIETYKNTAPSSPSFTPTPAPSANAEENPTPTPAAPTPTGREMVVNADQINGLISANPKSRGHAFVSLSGNKATVQVSISSDKVPNFPKGYLNGSFEITTDGPTPLTAIQVSKIQANGFSMPSGILSTTYRGNSLLGLALDAAAPYNVNTVEIRNGTVILR